MSVRKCLFFQDLEGLTEVFGRMSAGISGPKLPLWAEFSFLRTREEPRSPVRFGPRPGFSKQLSGSSREGTKLDWTYWAAANGRVTNGGLRGLPPPFLGIGRNRPFSPVFCLFRPFPEAPDNTWESPENGGKGPFSSEIFRFPYQTPIS